MEKSIKITEIIQYSNVETELRNEIDRILHIVANGRIFFTREAFLGDRLISFMEDCLVIDKEAETYMIINKLELMKLIIKQEEIEIVY